LKRKLGVLYQDEAFFELHTCAERSRSSSATEGEKDKISVQNGNFLANLKEFNPDHVLELRREGFKRNKFKCFLDFGIAPLW